MNLLLIGQGPLPCIDEPFCAFPQLRTWSMYKSLLSVAPKYGWSVQLELLSLNADHSLILENELIEALTWADVIVTSGPYYPFFILPHIPDDTPVWLDFPSDPFADRDAKHLVDPLNEDEWALVTALRQMALQRADGLGVISNRQKWVCYGALLETQAHHVPVETIPIAFDFPTSIQQARNGNDFLLAGSANAWLDLDAIKAHLQDKRVHCTGWNVPGYASREIFPNWIQYNWLKPTELEKVIENCQFGIWADRDGVESTLGSRTRALFYIWSGLTPIGTLHTELATELHHQDFLRTWKEDWTSIDIPMAQAYCQQQFSPQTIYAPLHAWLQAPKRIHRTHTNELAKCNLELREALSIIHNSPTWRIASRLHRLFKR